MEKDVFVYCLDADDTILSVSPNWETFAYTNASGVECSVDHVVGHSIWDFIHDFETRYLYKAVFRRVRSGKPCGPIPFRCDSPGERRFLELSVLPLADDGLEIRSRIKSVEPRDPVKLLDKAAQRSNELLRVCSMCKKLALPTGQWVEVEEGLSRMKLFETEEMPKLTHGVCPACYHDVIATLTAGDEAQPDVTPP